MGSWPAWVRWVAVLPTTALGLGMAAGMASGPNEPSHAIMLNPTSPCYQDVERDMESITGAKPLTLEWSGGDTYYGSFAAGKMELIDCPDPPQGTVVCHAGLWFINYFWLDRAHPIATRAPARRYPKDRDTEIKCWVGGGCDRWARQASAVDAWGCHQEYFSERGGCDDIL